MSNFHIDWIWSSRRQSGCLGTPEVAKGMLSRMRYTEHCSNMFPISNWPYSLTLTFGRAQGVSGDRNGRGPDRLPEAAIQALTIARNRARDHVSQGGPIIQACTLPARRCFSKLSNLLTEARLCAGLPLTMSTLTIQSLLAAQVPTHVQVRDVACTSTTATKAQHEKVDRRDEPLQRVSKHKPSISLGLSGSKQSDC